MWAFRLLLRISHYISSPSTQICSKSEGNSNYSDEAYWEDRYKQSTEPKKDVYEWYVSFSDIEVVFQEDVNELPAKGKSLILVSGCGNSTLCEDISNKGTAVIALFTVRCMYVLYFTVRL